MLGGGAGGGGTLFYDERVRGRRLPLAVTAESRTPPCLLGTLVVRWGRTAVGFGCVLLIRGPKRELVPSAERRAAGKGMCRWKSSV